jgi:energy-coupling factor transporter transmembrane protein EcfT
MALFEPEQLSSTIHPHARGLATLAAGFGTVLIQNPIALALLWVLVILPLIACARLSRLHLRFVMWILLPIAAALLVVWGYVVKAAPGGLPGSAPLEGLRFATATSFRLAVLGGLWQLCFLTIPPNALASTLRSWGLRRDTLVIALGSFAVMPDLAVRSRQVLSARYARGFLGRATWWSRTSQLPALLPPLVAWVLRSSIQRGETWDHRGLLRRFEILDDGRFFRWSQASVYLLLTALAWLAFGISSRMQ